MTENLFDMKVTSAKKIKIALTLVITDVKYLSRCTEVINCCHSSPDWVGLGRSAQVVLAAH